MKLFSKNFKKCFYALFVISQSLVLTQCTQYEHHGHYKFDEHNVKKDMTISDSIETFGAPLYLANNKNILYYIYSVVKRTWFGLSEETENKILRLEFENNRLKKYDIFNYTDYEANEARIEEPDMQLNLFSEIVGGIGGIVGDDSIKEKKQTFKAQGE